MAESADADLQVSTEGEDLDGDTCENTASEFSALDAEELEVLDAALRAGDDDHVTQALAQLYGPERLLPCPAAVGAGARHRRGGRNGSATRIG